MMSKKRVWAGLAVAMLVVAACGGGPTPAPATPVPIEVVVTREVTVEVTAISSAVVAAVATQLAAEAATATALPPTPTPVPPPTLAGSPQPNWEVETLLVAPGEMGRIYALVKDSPSPLWATPANVRLMISDDYAKTWTPFPGGLPVPPQCMINVGLDYFTANALYASTCQGLYAWDGQAWTKRSDRLTDVITVIFGEPNAVWAAASGDGVIRSDDGGKTWQDASTGLVTFGGLANLGHNPRDGRTLYAIIRPKYANSYLRRGNTEGNWQTLPTPLDNTVIETGMTVDGATGTLYVTTALPPVGLWRSSNANTPASADIQWEKVRDFDPTTRVSLLAGGWAPEGLAIYANFWPGWYAGSTTPIKAVLQRSADGGKTWQPLATP